jgi:hypothetical protein
VLASLRSTVGAGVVVAGADVVVTSAVEVVATGVDVVVVGAATAPSVVGGCAVTDVPAEGAAVHPAITQQARIPAINQVRIDT